MSLGYEGQILSLCLVGVLSPECLDVVNVGNQAE